MIQHILIDMYKTNKQNGFSAVIFLLLLIVILLTGFIGYYVWHAQSSSTSSTVTSSDTQQVKTTDSADNPYKGWKVYTLKNEKLSFKYPAEWTLKDYAADDIGDNIVLTGKDNFIMHISTGPDNGNFTLPLGGAHVKQSRQVSFAGKTGYLVAYSGQPEDGTVIDTELSPSKSDPADFFLTKNIGYSKPSVDAADSTIAVSVNWNADDSIPLQAKSISTINADPQYKQAELLIASMAY